MPKTRTFNLLLYPDNAEHTKVYSVLSDCGYDYVGILHDKDTYTDKSENHSIGELKKAHWHIMLQFENARHKSAVSKELGLDERFIDETKSFNSFAKYLLHRGVSDKHQYSTDELFGSLKNSVLKKLDKRSEDECVLAMLNLLDSIESVVTKTAFARMCVEAGLYSVYRRTGLMMRDYIEEHNSLYRKQ